jgi:hypothetical protein
VTIGIWIDPGPVPHRMRAQEAANQSTHQETTNMRETVKRSVCWLVGAVLAGATAGPAWASEHVILTNGMEMLCDHQQRVGDRVRIYMTPDSTGFLEFALAEVASVEPGPASAPHVAEPVQAAAEPVLTEVELQEMLAKAGAQHNLDVDLLASVIHAESGGNVHAVSRTGAQGLMQLMPKTAKELGVADSFHPEENINGGTAYLDSLLVKYHDKLALALAAYNAGPAAVDRFNGIPPYRETRAYVARVIREFNRAVAARKQHDAKPTILAANGTDHLPVSASTNLSKTPIATKPAMATKPAIKPANQRATTQAALEDHLHASTMQPR